MRVYDLITQHSIPWPPPVVSAVRPHEKVSVANEVRQATLESIFWGEDEGDARWWIDLHLEFQGRMLTGSLICPPGQKAIYQALFWALHRHLGQTLAEIENREVAR